MGDLERKNRCKYEGATCSIELVSNIITRKLFELNIKLCQRKFCLLNLQVLANLKFTMKVYKVIKPRVVSGNISLAEDKQNFSDSIM